MEGKDGSRHRRSWGSRKCQEMRKTISMGCVSLYRRQMRTGTREWRRIVVGGVVVACGECLMGGVATVVVVILPRNALRAFDGEKSGCKSRLLILEVC